MTVRQVFIVGAGLMGSGIAQVCAQRGIAVSLADLDHQRLDQAKTTIAWSVGKLVDKGKVRGPVEAVTERISFSRSDDGAAEAELIIEAVFEQLELKRTVFARLGQLARPEALIASNTSAIPITELAAVTNHPERVLGLHFFSPVPMMDAVEVVRGVTTSADTVAAGETFVRQLGKEPILVQRDVAGFLINRINLPSNLEAMRMVEQGVGTVEDIDKGLKLATGRKMGPFETGDMVGLDVTHGALMAIYQETRDPRWYPPQILRRKVTAGHLGRKTGKGWYCYNEAGKRTGPA